MFYSFLLKDFFCICNPSPPYIQWVVMDCDLNILHILHFVKYILHKDLYLFHFVKKYPKILYSIAKSDTHPNKALCKTKFHQPSTQKAPLLRPIPKQWCSLTQSLYSFAVYIILPIPHSVHSYHTLEYHLADNPTLHKLPPK